MAFIGQLLQLRHQHEWIQIIMTWIGSEREAVCKVTFRMRMSEWPNRGEGRWWLTKRFHATKKCQESWPLVFLIENLSTWIKIKYCWLVSASRHNYVSAFRLYLRSTYVYWYFTTNVMLWNTLCILLEENLESSSMKYAIKVCLL